MEMDVQLHDSADLILNYQLAMRVSGLQHTCVVITKGKSILLIKIQLQQHG
jgi:hypothetical protein